MLTVFYRRFYILLFLIWLGAVSGLFVLTVWGDFDTFISDFNKPVQMLFNGSSAVNGSETLLQVATEEATSVRREVIHEVRKVERDVEQFIEGNQTINQADSDPVKREIQEDLAANRTQAVSASKVGMLDNLEFTHTETEFLARLQTSSEVGRVTYFWMDKPSKLVVDLRGKWRYSVPRVTDFISGFVGQVVLGRHTDRLRLAFNFRNPEAEKGPSPQLIRTPQGLDIVVTEKLQQKEKE
ncbi:hypothetical protein [Maridesulfovibrio salexigens]|uniref:AMIN domain-containing protein n=1 Tax=Maridesulfovibrio salexigens (strain ATCC 14822 / DSM 2638 / NCIMB 8403 / VKM B-1763) TaxID=526222 RepID=C6BX23_MARSD|nr:hypothetical protein [Maridesulfovibrio salexigens]ACS78503.1 hypothetical protein Desal_0436 [Maridesulfovibrio salexigens DSM 2638]